MISNLISLIVENILLFIKDLGYLRIFLGMVVESSFFPFPSELILIPAGALVARGELNFILVLVIGIFGSLIGALINYFLAFSLGRKTIDFLVTKYGKVFLINKKRLSKIDNYFGKYGEITTDRKSTRLNSSHIPLSRMPSSA